MIIQLNIEAYFYVIILSVPGITREPHRSRICSSGHGNSVSAQPSPVFPIHLFLRVWPPTQRTRDGVIHRLIEILSTSSVLSKRYGTLICPPKTPPMLSAESRTRLYPLPLPTLTTMASSLFNSTLRRSASSCWHYEGQSCSRQLTPPRRQPRACLLPLTRWASLLLSPSLSLDAYEVCCSICS